MLTSINNYAISGLQSFEKHRLAVAYDNARARLKQIYKDYRQQGQLNILVTCLHVFFNRS